MIPLKIKLCLRFFIVVKNKALVKAQSTNPDCMSFYVDSISLLFYLIFLWYTAFREYNLHHRRPHLAAASSSFLSHSVRNLFSAIIHHCGLHYCRAFLGKRSSGGSWWWSGPHREPAGGIFCGNLFWCHRYCISVFWCW